MAKSVVENLLSLMNLPTQRFAGVVRTPDGCYIGMEHDSCGYNVFLGRPNPPHEGPGRQRMLEVWASLTTQEQKEVYDYADNPPDGVPILLHEDFGVPLPREGEDNGEYRLQS